MAYGWFLLFLLLLQDPDVAKAERKKQLRREQISRDGGVMEDDQIGQAQTGEGLRFDYFI